MTNGIKQKQAGMNLWHWLTLAWLGLTMVLGWAGTTQAAEDFLPVDQAFKLSASTMPSGQVVLNFKIAPGTYLYRERLHVDSVPASVKLAIDTLPTGDRKYDETFGKELEVYHQQLAVSFKVDPATPAGTPAMAQVGYQGCADAGLCYPPQVRHFRLTVAQGGKVIAVSRATPEEAAPDDASKAMNGEPAAPDQATNPLQNTLASGNVLKAVGVFFIAGLLLSFTPCVLPMVPILSSIIVGGGPVGRLRGFTLALSYSQGMALVYTLLGVAAGLLGEGLAASLQNPWVLGAFGIALVVLSLSMFGVYELHMPAFIHQRFTHHSRQLKGGSLVGVFFMGMLSALIVGPCVTGPLAGALVYLSQTHDVVMGGAALYALAWGMSVPLLLVGVSAGALLPRAGAWMASVQTFFGVLLLGVAWWLVSPVLPPLALLLSLGALLTLAAAFAGGFDHLGPQASLKHRAFKALGVLLALLATAQVAGALAGAQSPWDPLRPFIANTATVGPTTEAQANSHQAFKRVRSLAELDAAVAEAAKAGQATMLDFYADWCVSCKEMERFTFSDARVQSRLQNTQLLQADVTANNADDKALLKRFGLFGPPGILFFSPQGQELPAARVIGFQKADTFLNSLQTAGL
ncbi:MAG: protein-disulfide reductase DsbD [Rubrivivax sp.]|nr:MAG: protein-disulfide reductase DsbD [Rubrivivax sp.]